MKRLWNGAPIAGMALCLAAAAERAESKEVHRTISLDPDGIVAMKTYKGTIAVTTWDRREVQVDARIEAEDRDPDGREKVDQTEVRISGSGRSVRIESEYDAVDRRARSFWGLFEGRTYGRPFVHYTVRMPSTARLEMEDYKGRIHVENLRSDLKLNSYKGMARIEKLDGAADIETYKGEIRLDFSRFDRRSRFETYKGAIEVRLPSESRFQLHGDMGRRGLVDSEFDMTVSAGRRSRGGRVTGTVNGGGPELLLETHKGVVRLRRL